MHVHFLLMLGSSRRLGLGEGPDIMGASWLVRVERGWTRQQTTSTTESSTKTLPWSHGRFSGLGSIYLSYLPVNSKSATEKLKPVSCNLTRLCPVTRQVDALPRIMTHAMHMHSPATNQAATATLAEVRKARSGS